MDNILSKIDAKTRSIGKFQADLEKNKLEASEARKVEQVFTFILLFLFLILFCLFFCHCWVYGCGKSTYSILQECIKERDLLIPHEQEARQKVTELKSVMELENSQGSVLKAILQAKESNKIEGIYGRLGDLGAIDGEFFYQ